MLWRWFGGRNGSSPLAEDIAVPITCTDRAPLVAHDIVLLRLLGRLGVAPGGAASAGLDQLLGLTWVEHEAAYERPIARPDDARLWRVGAR